MLREKKFDEELRAQEPDIDRMTYVAEEILMSCHRSAERYVRYHMTTMQSRWQQVNSDFLAHSGCRFHN